jgi:paraquat-inducible protein B
MNSNHESNLSPQTIPHAQVKRPSLVWLWWIIPVLALSLSLYLSWRHFNTKGWLITLSFQNGHGLKKGDAVRFRGTQVGTIEDISARLPAPQP